MIKKINFVFEKTECPYADDNKREYWRRILLTYHYEGMQVNILDWQWYVDGIIEWFSENKYVLSTKEINVVNDEDRSIAELRDLAFSRDFFFSEEEQDEYYNQLEKYFIPHVFHLKGTTTPLFYIGLNRGLGEISYFDNIMDKYIAYNFDMSDFVINTQKALSCINND